MKPPPFDYHVPSTLEEAIDLLAEYGDDAKPLAGGQSLIPAMNFRLARPSVLIDLGRLSELLGIRQSVGSLESSSLESNVLRIGAMTTHREVEHSDLVASETPLLHMTMPHIAHPQIRNRGTFGGSLAHADPAAELPAVILALGGRCRALSRRGERWIDAREFFPALFETAMEPDELLVEVELPAAQPNTGFAFHEMARRFGDFALAGAAASVTLGADGRCAKASVGLLSVGEAPVLAAHAVDLVSETPDDAAIASTAAAIARDLEPPADIHASTEYRRHLATVLTRRALTDAMRRATAS